MTSAPPQATHPTPAAALRTGETIAAIATAIVPNQGSVGIVRLSGDRAWAIARDLFRAPGRQTWESHRILYGWVVDPASGERVDEALLLLMQAPRSFTREDVAEIHCHGGLMGVQRVLALCLAQGARLAISGEFTLRAFLNGRIDLTQAESVAELVGANSPAAARLAMAGMQGKLAGPVRSLRSRCLDVLADLEARLDFADDLPPLAESEIIAGLKEIATELQRWLATADQGELLRSGLKVAIVGQPNAGKSSLLNAWSRSDRAIVTDLPGTTRDVVESRLVVGGIPVLVLDTAGIRDTEDVVEQLGVARSRAAAREADLILLTIDAGAGLQAEDRAILAGLGLGQRPPVILVANKTDLHPQPPPPPGEEFAAVVSTVATTGEGIEALEAAILELAWAGRTQAADGEVAINQRQAEAIGRAQQAIGRVEQTIVDGLPVDFWTIDLRAAIQALGEVTGDDLVESVLDRIFSRFCLGK